MSKSNFVSLHNHTELGSPLDGMNNTHDLFVRAREVDHPAVAITDHGTMTAHFDAYKASQRTGVKMIPGMEAYFSDDLNEKKSHHLVLLAKSEIGYKNLLRLNYLSYQNQVSGYMGKKTPRISWEHIEKYNKDVIALTACCNGLIAKTLITERDEDKAIEHIRRMNSIFRDRFFLELQPHALSAINKNGKEVNQVKLNESLLRLSHDMNIPYVITCDAHYRDREHAKYHDFMLAIKDKKAVDDPDRFRYGVQDMYLKTDEEILDFFGKDIAETGMANSIKIMESCAEPHYIKPRGPMLPTFPVKEEEDYGAFKSWYNEIGSTIPEDKAYLRYKCVQGFKEKYGDLDSDDKEEHWDRVKMELSVLEDKDFSSYMLIVSDYINWAKQRMPVGPARGSVAGSLVAYLTGITSIDPIEYGLIFERFHNNKKESFPDVDSDFSKPGLVKEYIREKYGKDRVASISNWSTLSPKVAIKDIARSLRLGGDKSTAFKIANSITSIMPDVSNLKEAINSSREFEKYMKKYPEVHEYAEKLQNLTRNWSVHAAGVVIGDTPLYDKVPLRIDGDLVVTQWEKTRCEEYGLIKMDLLGLKTLTVIDNTLKLICERTGELLTVEGIDLKDSDTYDMIGRGRTCGMFQLESSLTPFCIRIKPKNIEEISAINALGRPSCLPAQRKAYMRRKVGLDPVTYRHPKLERALEKTYGISLYEESMMVIAQDCAGWDLNQADALRKITKLKGKDPDLVLRTEASFLKDCMEYSGMTYKEAKDIWDKEIIPFGKYGFNKSHSVSYSHISFYTAWLKCHYPSEFMCSLLNSEDPNSDKTQEYLDECNKMDINILPPDANKSGGNYKILDNNEIITGLSAVKGVGEKAILSIVENQPFSSFSEFITKNDSRTVGKIVIQSLAKSGALDSFERTRKDMHDNYQKYRTKAKDAIKKGKTIDEVVVPEYDEEWDRKNILLYEREVLGRSISGNLHEVFSTFFTRGANIVSLSSVDKHEKGDKVRVEAIIKNKLKEFKIKNGRNVGKKFAKYLIEDVNGNTCGMTVWADDYERYREVLKDGMPLKAICRVNEYLDQKDLALSSLERVYGRKL